MNNEKNTIDDQVRAALEHFEQPYNAEHWRAMSEKLAALDAADASFDASLRERLADISALPMADAWSKMADKLDDLDAEDVSFDATLRGRLADVSATPKMGDWSKMAAALDSFDDTESEFDEILRRKLENIAGNHPNHWAMMNERLDREFTLKGKIVRYKIVEAALILLALFTVINTVDWDTLESDTNAAGLKAVTSEQSATSDKAAIQNPKFKTQNLKTEIQNLKIETQNSKSKTPLQYNSPKSLKNTANWRERGGIQLKNGQNKGQKEQKTLQNSQNSQPHLTPIGQPIVDNSAKNGAIASAFNPTNPPNTEGSSDVGLRISDVGQQGGSADKIGESIIDASKKEALEGDNNAVKSTLAASQALAEVVPTIDVLQANLLKNSKLDMPINIIKPVVDKKARWRLSVFGTAALDWVRTSYVAARVQNFQEQRVANYGVNTLVAYQKGRVEVETGLSFNQKIYSIANVERTSGSTSRGLKQEKPDKLRLSILSMPLNFNVKVKASRRWDVYAHTGVAVNAIVDAFDYNEKIVTEPDPNQPPPAGPPQNSGDNEIASYSKGLINGGETKDNVYWTGQIGAGIEYKLTPKTSLFLQPTASFILSKKRGIGTLNDRIQTYSIQAGAKWRL